MSAVKTIMNRVAKRVQRWWQLDPEFAPYMPMTNSNYRFPSPVSQPDAKVPKQEFMKEFKIKYFKRDYRTQNLAKNAFHTNFEIVYRQDVVRNPFRVMPGESVGPWYGFGMDKKVLYVFDERENKQVYSHKRSRDIFKPQSVAVTEEDEAFASEETYQHAKQQ